LLEFTRHQQAFDVFSKRAIELLDKRNHQAFITPDGWETDYANYRVHAMWLEGVLETAYNLRVQNIKIYPFKKDGLLVKGNWKKEDEPKYNEYIQRFHIISACKKGFHRDWKHDAVCVQDLPWEPQEPIDHPEGYTRQELES